jgi:hypothetical protein
LTAAVAWNSSDGALRQSATWQDPWPGRIVSNRFDDDHGSIEWYSWHSAHGCAVGIVAGVGRAIGVDKRVSDEAATDLSGLEYLRIAPGVSQTVHVRSGVQP